MKRVSSKEKKSRQQKLPPRMKTHSNFIHYQLSIINTHTHVLQTCTQSFRLHTTASQNGTSFQLSVYALLHYSIMASQSRTKFSPCCYHLPSLTSLIHNNVSSHFKHLYNTPYKFRFHTWSPYSLSSHTKPSLLSKTQNKSCGDQSTQTVSMSYNVGLLWRLLSKIQ